MVGPSNAVDDVKPEPRPKRPPSALTFWYKNWRGEEGYRRVKPISIRFGTSEWHKEPQWLMLAEDLNNDRKRREFAVKDMSGVIGTPTIWIKNVAN